MQCMGESLLVTGGSLVELGGMGGWASEQPGISMGSWGVTGRHWGGSWMPEFTWGGSQSEGEGAGEALSEEEEEEEDEEDEEEEEEEDEEEEEEDEESGNASDRVRGTGGCGMGGQGRFGGALTECACVPPAECLQRPAQGPAPLEGESLAETGAEAQAEGSPGQGERWGLPGVGGVGEGCVISLGTCKLERETPKTDKFGGQRP